MLLVCAGTAGLLGVLAGLYMAFSRDLPSIPDLRAYRPKTVSTFYAADGSVIGLFYREKRFPISVGSLPPHVVNAFLAAEDARFFAHGGLDYQGVVRAFVRNLKAGNFSQGGSTITQQVTRNLLLSKEKKISRKVREAILAYRLERTLTKNEILELYLNEIYLGKGAYGVESASRTYFGKPAKDLDVTEAAFLAGLVANPSKYSQQRNLEAALRRKEIVLGRMVRNGFMGSDEYQTALQKELSFREDLPTPFDKVPYFTEAVRQYIISRYGESRLYNEGLQVWTTCDLQLQQTATDSLIKGAHAWEKRQGRPRGLVKRLEPAEVQSFLSRPPEGSYSEGDVISAVVMSNETLKQGKQKKKPADMQQNCVVALEGNKRQGVTFPAGVLYRPNDLVRFRIKGIHGEGLELELLDAPSVQGALICIENRTGFVKSLVGGLDFDTSNFNRATQALRQPGSAFKPVLYAAGLEYAGLGPYSAVVDEPIAILSQSKDSPWIPSNSDGGFQGMMPLSQALARSRNIPAVKVYLDVGAEGVMHMARSMGIRSAMGKNPSLSLGASEVTLMELTAAYTVFPNLGMRMPPVLVKKVVDRYGRVLEDNTDRSLNLQAIAQSNTPQAGAAADELKGRHPQTAVEGFHNGPAFPNVGKGEISDIHAFLENSFPGGKPTAHSPEQVISPESAYLVASMLREACVTGTARSLSKLKRPDVAGKTGTTDDCTDAWFIGFNSTYTTGVWMGYDTKVSLGRREYGSVAALPIWTDFMKKAFENQPPRALPVPPYIVFRHDNQTLSGTPPLNAWQATPDFPDNYEVKPAVSVDSGQLGFLFAGSDPVHWHLGILGNPFYHAYAANLTPSAGQALRLFSASGEDLGYGVPARDERGRFTIMPVYGPREDWSSRGSSQAGIFAYPNTSYQQNPYWEGPSPNIHANPYHGMVR